MTTVLNELAVLEDGEGADYSQVTIDYRWLVQNLNIGERLYKKEAGHNEWISNKRITNNYKHI